MMLMGLTREIKPGEKITLHLTFAKAGEITTEAEARTQKRGQSSPQFDIKILYADLQDSHGFLGAIGASLYPPKRLRGSAQNLLFI